jgi:hypothetical protein
MAALMPGTGLRRALATTRRAVTGAGMRAVCALPLALAACEPSPTAIVLSDRSVVLHGMIVAGAEHATVVLTEMHDGPSGLRALPLSGARVQLISGPDTTRLEQRNTAGPCTVSPFVAEAVLLDACYSAAVPGGIRAGARYNLHVVLSDGRVIRGSTTVPPAATLLHPVPGTEITVPRHSLQAPPAPIDIGWHHDLLPDLAELRLATGVPACVVLLQSGSAMLLAKDVTGMRDDTVQPRLSCREDAWVDRLSAEVVLTVFDSNYARYVRHAMHSGSALHPDAASGITGAFGVFGSAATDRVPVSIVVRQLPAPHSAQ